MVAREAAGRFAQAWVSEWNAHVLDVILSHYNVDFEMSSPLIAERMYLPSGVLKGKACRATGHDLP